MKRWIDPPSGYRYGFPRLYDPDKDGTVEEFLIHIGYPEYDIDFALKHMRSWQDHEETQN